ncbi:hypothetical protein SAMN04488136_13528 [Vibrio xiamenensis]|uniref:C factor cell-cell signaling protein n=1 Tax=Vibrio xiamenensis TaxID=861298 RepID=A0A1G8G8P9_9VIBR|nr:hypothetical protein [Vibrio xiamenensis]SDH90670.1 hypothetical protein SAMN04488136_13528 [Vibrio xiamenensis]
MKVLIQFDQAGKYKDNLWDSTTLRAKGDIQAVTPAYAAHLIKEKQAHLYTDENNEVVFSA